MTLHRPHGPVSRTDLLERPVAPVATDAGVVTLDLQPFELVTLVFDPA